LRPVAPFGVGGSAPDSRAGGRWSLRMPKCRTVVHSFSMMEKTTVSRKLPSGRTRTGNGLARGKIHPVRPELHRDALDRLEGVGEQEQLCLGQV
jgi:hypothetical protein